MLIDFTERGRKGGEKERNIKVREKHRSVVSCRHPDLVSNLQPRYVLLRRIKLMTFGVWGDAPTNSVTLARAMHSFLNITPSCY